MWCCCRCFRNAPAALCAVSHPLTLAQSNGRPILDVLAKSGCFPDRTASGQRGCLQVPISVCGLDPRLTKKVWARVKCLQEHKGSRSQYVNELTCKRMRILPSMHFGDFALSTVKFFHQQRSLVTCGLTWLMQVSRSISGTWPRQDSEAR